MDVTPSQDEYLAKVCQEAEHRELQEKSSDQLIEDLEDVTVIDTDGEDLFSSGTEEPSTPKSKDKTHTTDLTPSPKRSITELQGSSPTASARSVINRITAMQKARPETQAITDDISPKTKKAKTTVPSRK